MKNYRELRRRDGADDDHKEGAETWLVSFTDVMALMLTFFVLLFSMSKPREHQWQGMLSALKLEFKKNLNDEWLSGPKLDASMARIRFNQAQPVTYLQTLFEEYKADNIEALSNMTIYGLPDMLILSWPRSFFFEDGESEVKSEARQALYAMSDRLSSIKNQIQLVGRTVNTAEVYDNDIRGDWLLSLERAAAVAAVLEKVGYSKQVIIRGDANGRYLGLSEIKDGAHRMERADRMDLVIMDNNGTIVLNPTDSVLR